MPSTARAGRRTRRRRGPTCMRRTSGEDAASPRSRTGCSASTSPAARWPELTSFLAETEKGSADAVADAEAAAAVAHARPEELGPFPHADVFWLSAVTQAGWQLQRLWRASRRAVGVAVVLLVLLRPAFADHGQCRRACAVANGAGMPEVHGMTGHWFHHGIDGRRAVLDPSLCVCSSTNTAFRHKEKEDHRMMSEMPHPTVSRLHPPLATPKQWWFRTKSVCGSDGVTYTSAGKARTKGADVVNCGQCAKHSTINNVEAMHARSRTLTRRASIAAIGYLLFGEWITRLVYRSPFIGYDQDGAECWVAATQCNLASCAHECLWKWNNPLRTANTAATGTTTTLNACLHCDEIHCSAYYFGVWRQPPHRRRRLRHQATGRRRLRRRTDGHDSGWGRRTRTMRRWGTYGHYGIDATRVEHVLRAGRTRLE